MSPAVGQTVYSEKAPGARGTRTAARPGAVFLLILLCRNRECKLLQLLRIHLGRSLHHQIRRVPMTSRIDSEPENSMIIRSSP